MNQQRGQIWAGRADAGAFRRGDFIAAYGLLRPAAARWKALGLAGGLHALGPCQLRGDLRDLGAYPGFVPGDGVVEGDLLRLEQPALGARIDAFEDVEPTALERSVYVRSWLRLAHPRAWAWVYVWTGTARAPRVPGGDWLAYAAGRGKGVRTRRRP